MRVTKAAGPYLKPYIPDVITVIANAMSELEPSMLSYLQFHTGELNMTYEGLEELRLSLANTGPLAESLELCLSQVDGPVAASVVPWP